MATGRKNELYLTPSFYRRTNMHSGRNVFYSSFEEKAIPEFKLDANSFFPYVNVLDDVVLKAVSEKEYEYMKFFSDKVLGGELHNFPIVYGRGEPFEDETGIKVIVEMEKFDADYTNIDQSEQSTGETLSMYIQIFMALYSIDSFGKYHGDLNPGNVLYKTITPEEELDSEHPGYLKYIIDGETYYVKHFNTLWVIADFELMGDKGEVLPADVFTEQFFQRVFGELYDKIDKPVRGGWLYDMFVFTKFIESSKANERIFGLMQVKSGLNPFEAIPHIIKNDLSRILVKE